MKTRTFIKSILSVLLAGVMIFILAGITIGKDKADTSKKKKMYIASIKAEGVTEKITRQIKEGVRLSIFENHGSEYQVLDDESVKIMYKQAEKIMTSGCDDTSCMQQIADGINAEEVIYGTVERDGLKININLTNLQRKGVDLTSKSIVNIMCSESEIDHYSREAAKKLIDPKYTLKKADIISSSEISLKVIDTTKIEGLDISVLKFKSSDDTISQVIEKLKVIVEKGDDYFKKADYESAREEYETVIKRIETKIPPAKQLQLTDYVMKIDKRISATYAMEIKRSIEEVDKKVENNKNVGFDDLQGLYEEYLQIIVPTKYYGSLSQMNVALRSRRNSILITMMLVREKEGDVHYKDYKEHRFDLAIFSYEKAKKLSENLDDDKIKKEQIARLNKKIATTIETGNSYMASMVKNYSSRALVFNVDDDTSAAKSSMKDAYKLLTGDMKSFVTDVAIASYNEMAKQLGLEELNYYEIKNQKDNNTKYEREINKKNDYKQNIDSKKNENEKNRIYKIGERGPGGGWIFYDSGNSFGGWRYLEVAPADQSIGLQWYRGAFLDTGATGTSIGDGFDNTKKIISIQGKGSYAAVICSDYTGGGKNDWFLPSKDELNLIYWNLHLKGVGNFVLGYYWSSSEGFSLYAWGQNFNSGGQDNITKDYTKRVRAIRAFK